MKNKVGVRGLEYVGTNYRQDTTCTAAAAAAAAAVQRVVGPPGGICRLLASGRVDEQASGSCQLEWAGRRRPRTAKLQRGKRHAAQAHGSQLRGDDVDGRLQPVINGTAVRHQMAARLYQASLSRGRCK